jgi:hypothetical protein
MTPQTTAVRGEFEYETQMAHLVVRWMRRNALAVKCEYSVPWGICDVVGMKFDSARVQLRLSYGQKRPIGPPLRLHVLSMIPDHRSGKSITLRRLHRESLSYLPEHILEREISRLKQAKFIRSPKSGLLQRLNGWTPLHARIVAVELKLSKVSEALVQACLNRTFATESYVALPADLALRLRRSRRVGEFKRNGIGLLAVSSDSCRKVLLSSSDQSLCNEVLQAHCVERFWRTRDSSP